MRFGGRIVVALAAVAVVCAELGVGARISDQDGAGRERRA